MDEQTTGILGVVAILRFALIVWATIVVAVDITGVTPIHGARAVVVLVGLTLWTALFATLVRARSTSVPGTSMIVADLVISAAAAASDPFVYPGSHPQSFPSAWPLSGAVVVGTTRGARAGATAGLGIGVAGALGVVIATDDGISGRLLGSLGTIVLLSVAGLLAGVLSDRIREVELTRARAQIREETARRLHDGVLQTLAVIQRRSNDRELVRLARDQESDLRAFIARPGVDDTAGSTGAGSSTTVSGELRRVLTLQEQRFEVRTDLVVVEEPRSVAPMIIDAVGGAVSEAVTNASRHGGSSVVTVFVDFEDDALRIEVRDDGRGFDTGSVHEGTGITRSIRGRIGDVGGHVDIGSVIGRGTTVTIVVPVGRRRPPRADTTRMDTPDHGAGS